VEKRPVELLDMDTAVLHNIDLGGDLEELARGLSGSA
jgi:hypothetical protein